MNTEEQIENYISSQPSEKKTELQALDRIIRQQMPDCKLWFLDGKNSDGKVVSNPNIGYGSYYIQYSNGTSREFYQIGLSANTAGISVYIMGIADKKYLANTFGTKLGKATVTGYCIKFKTLKDIALDELTAAIQYGIKASAQ